MQYKVGDEVLVRGAITGVHEGTDHPYFVAVNYDSVRWLSEDKIIPMDKTYAQGLADAWELARKICHEPKKGGFSNAELSEIFETVIVEGILERYTVEEALAKIEAYEKEKEIKVGDVVTTSRHGYTGVVVKLIADDRVNVLYDTGYVEGCYKKTDCVKTGKHIDIESLLKEIGE